MSQARTSIGFDFGTTNSLVSVISGDRVIDVVDESGRPYPSVVRYEGEEVIVGQEARQALEEVGIGVHGNTIRSPKFLLGQEAVSVGGVERSPVDIVAAVIRHVRAESLRSGQRQRLGNLDRAVVTIPVIMNGPRRAALREAFAQADMSVVQFVHEPLAALYGYLRGADDPESAIRRLMRRNVLVVDWGGGTLDLTLCRLARAVSSSFATAARTRSAETSSTRSSATRWSPGSRCATASRRPMSRPWRPVFGCFRTRNGPRSRCPASVTGPPFTARATSQSRERHSSIR